MPTWSEVLTQQKSYTITELIPNTQYTLSINGVSDGTIEAYLGGYKIGEFVDNRLTFTPTQAHTTLTIKTIGDLSLANIKLEQGSVAHPWTPAEETSVDEIRVFEYVQVTSEPHDIDTMALITKQSIDLLNPQNNTLTFGFSYQTFTDKQFQSDKVLKEIKADYVVNEQVSEVRDSVTALSSNIEQTAEQIRTEVAETYVSTGALDSYKSEVSTQFTQTSTDYTYLFNQLDTYVQTLDGDTQAQFIEIQKYIRFKDGNIELGDSTSQIKLVLENDIIKFEQNGVPVAYIDNNTLYITDGQFLNSLRIGNFAFTPRANGNLSFGKVV